MSLLVNACEPVGLRLLAGRATEPNDAMDETTDIAATAVHPTGAPPTGAAPRPARPVASRDVLEASYQLTREQWTLAGWDLLGAVASGTVWLALVMAIGVALLIPTAWFALDSGLGVLAYASHVTRAVLSLRGVLSLFGLTFCAFLMAFALCALVQAGVYGRLAARVQTPGKPTEPFWSTASQWFPVFVGYQGVRLLLDLGLALYAMVSVAIPAARIVAMGELGWSMANVSLLALGCASTSLLALMLYLWRMATIGPLLAGGRLWEAWADGAAQVGRDLARYVRLVVGAAIVLSPALFVYLAVALMGTVVSTIAGLEPVGAALRLTVDIVFACVLSLAFVYLGAVFLVQDHVSRKGALPPRTAARRSALRVGQPVPLPLPGFADVELVVMPLPQSNPHVVRISTLFPNLVAGRSTPVDEAGASVPPDSHAPTSSEPTSTGPVDGHGES